jgi:large subunit ribosomal protein L17
MRHHKKNRTLGRERNQRRALIRSLVRALALDKKIHTTEARAKEIQPTVEKLITKGKNPTLANRRLMIAKTGSEEVTHELITIATQYADRKGGYTRVLKTPARAKDAAKMAIIAFV